MRIRFLTLELTVEDELKVKGKTVNYRDYG